MYTRSARLYDALYASKGKSYASEAAELHDLIARRCPQAKNLLDVGCGTGAHLEQFAQWYTVEGVDIEPEMLEMARARLVGVPLHDADMATLDLGDSRFDAVVCLFSAVGHLMSTTRLQAAVGAMARHLNPGGVLVVEPWRRPEDYRPGSAHALYVDEPNLKVARITVSEKEGNISRMVMHYLVATPDGVSYFTEPMELALFTDAEYGDAFTNAGLDWERLEGGPTGRDLYVGTLTI
jgi:ubiquinone/menaquinone biosynthesis C-methylase UbiE